MRCTHSTGVVHQLAHSRRARVVPQDTSFVTWLKTPRLLRVIAADTMCERNDRNEGERHDSHGGADPLPRRGCHGAGAGMGAALRDGCAGWDGRLPAAHPAAVRGWRSYNRTFSSTASIVLLAAKLSSSRIELETSRV